MRPWCLAGQLLRYAGVATGNVNRNSAPPPGARPTVIDPPWASTMPLKMYMPRTLPPRGALRVEVPGDGGRDVDGLTSQFEPPGVDAGDVEQLRDEPGHPVRV